MLQAKLHDLQIQGGGFPLQFGKEKVHPADKEVNICWAKLCIRNSGQQAKGLLLF
jgi:hypothetical protein